MSLAVSEEDLRIVREILAAHLPADAKVRAFGSRAKNTHRPYSDLDLAVKGRSPLSLANLADLADAFSESDLPYKVDVVDLMSADPTVREIVERDSVDF